MNGAEQIKVMELVKKLSDVLKGSDMETSATALSMCIAFCIDAAGSEADEARKFVNKVINETLKNADKAKGKWGRLLAKLMEA